MRMRKRRISFVLVCVVFVSAACGGGQPNTPASQPGTTASLFTDAKNSDTQVCSPDDGVTEYFATSFQLPQYSSSHTDTTLFRCLRFLDSAAVRKNNPSIQIVDIRNDALYEDYGIGGLQIPLYEIKAKAFLRERQIAIVSDGKRFAALEKECNDIKSSGVQDVYALLGTTQLRNDGGQGAAQPAIMLPKDFLAERGFGVWHIVNLTRYEVLEEPVFKASNLRQHRPGNSQDKNSVAGLERTLIVFDKEVAWSDEREIDQYAGPAQVFILEGGLESLNRYRAESAAMALALAKPRISERGCSS